MQGSSRPYGNFSAKQGAFKQRFQRLLERDATKFNSFHVGKHQPVYVCGDPADEVYFIERGQVKLLMLSPEGKECLVAINTAGDIFGELALTALLTRQETAVTMEHTILKQIPRKLFLLYLTNELLLGDFVQYLAARIAEQQQCIANLITVDSEHRLGETLLLLAGKLGQPNHRSTRIEHKITHEELSEMVGTTRPRITEFMIKFRNLGLIELSTERFLIVKEQALAEYLARAS